MRAQCLPAERAFLFGPPDGRPKRHAPTGVTSIDAKVADRSDRSDRCRIGRIGVGIDFEIGIDPCSGWRPALMDRSNPAAKFGQPPNNTVAHPRFLVPESHPAARLR
ncbi:MAG TPA: hypothetical protein DEW46_15965, partial [Verrucomicrobia bacterium]|nr:hypothetical protein [Verrucomicrobiota bacterium]